LMFESLDELDKHHGPKASPCMECLGNVFNIYYEQLRNAYEADELI